MRGASVTPCRPSMSFWPKQLLPLCRMNSSRICTHREEKYPMYRKSHLFVGSWALITSALTITLWSQQPVTQAGVAALASTSIATVQDSSRSEEHTSELQSLRHLVCRLL